jgi:hypothetical protein
LEYYKKLYPDHKPDVNKIWQQDRVVYEGVTLLKVDSIMHCAGCYFSGNNNCNHPAGRESGINSDALRGCRLKIWVKA